MPKQKKLVLEYITTTDSDVIYVHHSPVIPVYLHYTFVLYCFFIWVLIRPLVMRLLAYLKKQSYGENPPPESETSDEGKVDKAEFMWFSGSDYEDNMYYYGPVKRPMANIRLKKSNYIDNYYKKFQAYCKKNGLSFKERYT
jgi:hypothetical protein